MGESSSMTRVLPTKLAFSLTCRFVRRCEGAREIMLMMCQTTHRSRQQQDHTLSLLTRRQASSHTHKSANRERGTGGGRRTRTRWSCCGDGGDVVAVHQDHLVRRIGGVEVKPKPRELLHMNASKMQEAGDGAEQETVVAFVVSTLRRLAAQTGAPGRDGDEDGRVCVYVDCVRVSCRSLTGFLRLISGAGEQQMCVAIENHCALKACVCQTLVLRERGKQVIGRKGAQNMPN